jgi:predicted Fe-S protein YdhL (DUF1289 family)
MKEYSKLCLHSIHARIKTKYGKPNYCEHCKRSDKKVYHWANKDHKYSENILDWMRLCAKCHMKYDLEKNDYKGFWWNVKGKECPAKK